MLHEIAEKLKANPIYALSLGSRELFHTNFLAWLFENYPETVSLITGIETETISTIEREKHNLDLLVKGSTRGDKIAIVIEFKVKDAPRSSQLERYDKTIQKHIPHDIDIKKILISLVGTPPGTEANQSWNYLSLGEIGENLKSFTAQPNRGVSLDHLAIIKNYGELCENLHHFTQAFLKSETDERIYFLPRKQDIAQNSAKKQQSKEQIAENIRFGDTLNKYRASLMARDLSKELDYHENNNLKLDIRHGFDRKNAHVGATVIWMSGEKPKLRLSLGVHIQSTQYRRIIAFSGFSVSRQSEGKNEERMIRFIDSTDQWIWLFGTEHENGFFLNPAAENGYFSNHQKIATRMRKNKKICSYAPIYLYQYANIGYANYEVRPDQVVSAVVADIEHARKLLSDSDYLSGYLNWIDSYNS